MSKRTIINKESIRREIAADLGIKIDEDDPMLLAAHIAALVTRDIIAQERAHNADTQLLSFGDIRNVLVEARDEAILTSKQLLGIVFMQAKEEGIEMAAGLLTEERRVAARRREYFVLAVGVIAGVAIATIAHKLNIY